MSFVIVSAEGSCLGGDEPTNDSYDCHTFAATSDYRKKLTILANVVQRSFRVNQLREKLTDVVVLNTEHSRSNSIIALAKVDMCAPVSAV